METINTKSFYTEEGKLKNYYKTLGVSSNATPLDIKRAYRQKAKEMHPDIHPELKEDMTFVNEAYEVLNNGAKKAAYEKEYKQNAAKDNIDNGATDVVVTRTDEKDIEMYKELAYRKQQESQNSELRRDASTRSTEPKQTSSQGKISTKELYICYYDRGDVDIFVSHDFKKQEKDSYFYRTGIIYQGVSSDKIGAKLTNVSYPNREAFVSPGWSICLAGKDYIANCKIKTVIPFEKMRDLALEFFGSDYPVNELDIELGKAYPCELVVVLKYARRHYNLGPNTEKRPNF